MGLIEKPRDGDGQPIIGDYRYVKPLSLNDNLTPPQPNGTMTEEFYKDQLYVHATGVNILMDGSPIGRII